MPDNQNTATTKPQKSLWQRQIPTILGILILLIALVGGVILVGQNTGVFSPRATPETTPKNIKVTNVNDSSFTVSFITDEQTAGFVKYGTEASKTSSQSSDDRDQLAGTVDSYTTHHITVRGLQANTTYYYLLGTGSRSTFDNNGQPFTIKTAQRGGAPSAAKTTYGTVLTPAGSPAEGSIVYVSIQGVGEMSSLVKSSGSWAVPLSNARLSDGSGYAEITDDESMNILIQGSQASQRSQFTATVAQSQPVATVTLGQNPDLAQQSETGATATEASSSATASDTGTETNDNQFATLESNDSLTESSPGGLNDLIGQNESVASEAATIVDLTKADTAPEEPIIVNTTQPVIKGVAAPNVKVTITIHSETQIQQELISDGNGGFTLDIEALKQQLEPGEHTATYSYIDPTTGQEVTKTVTFTVEAPTSTQTADSGTPYGSGNPYPVGSTSTTSSTTTTTTSTSSATPTPTTTSTRSAVPASSSAIPVSGSVGTTLALLLGGTFFLIAGIWSFWLARQIEEVEA